jgi:hypothetical protein
MTAQGPRKGESSSCSMRNGFRTQPARLVRGSSRRIMSMRFRPANIRVINRRVCSSAVIGPAVPNKTSSRPTSRNVFAPEPPSNVSPLPERCSQSRVRFAAPNSGAPLTAALRSGPLLLRRAAPAGTLNGPLKINPVSRHVGLDRVTPYQNLDSRASCARSSGPTAGLLQLIGRCSTLPHTRAANTIRELSSAPITVMRFRNIW